MPQLVAVIKANSSIKPTIAGQLRRFRGTQISTSAILAADGHNSLFIWFSADDDEVVVTVSVEVCGAPRLSVTEAGLRLHVAGSLGAIGLIEQLRLTAPKYPFVPATLMIDVFPIAAPRFTVIGPSLPLAPLGPKLASAMIVRATVVDAVSQLARSSRVSYRRGPCDCGRTGGSQRQHLRPSRCANGKVRSYAAWQSGCGKCNSAREPAHVRNRDRARSTPILRDRDIHRRSQ